MAQAEIEPRLAVGRAAWWLPRPNLTLAPATLMVEDAPLQKLSFASALKDLLRNLSFHCYGKLVEHGSRIQERFFWLIFHITALSVLIAFLWSVYRHETDALVTSIYNPLYPVARVRFPVISVCSMNRISQQAIWSYAQELSSKDVEHRNVSYFYDELHAFNMYYDAYASGDYRRILRFQVLLDLYDTQPDDLFFNTKRRMRSLTPKCSDIFVSCRLAGQSFDCLQKVAITLTSYGYCCTMDLTESHVEQRSHKQRYFGADMGLMLTLRSNRSDHFKKLMQSYDFIYIKEQGNYPQSQSGGVTARYVQAGQNTNLPVRAKIFETVEEARQMSPKARNCLFKNEMPHVFGNNYSFSNCISACRARSIYSLCECLPFNLPSKFVGGSAGRVFCSLRHMECLKRYTFKWLNVITSRAAVVGLEHEMEDALYCPDCMASCSETRYRVRGAMTLANSQPTQIEISTIKHCSSIDNNSYDTAELAVVRVYFAQTHIPYYRQIIKNAWYEHFSRIGNICGIIAGFSLIGICELLFFLAKQLWHICKKELREAQQELARAQTNGPAKATHQHQQQQHQPMELLILP
ncbi:sodium channel protein Nach [Drosophila busckii]|uniref:sodium channel protein Nach n=1 Tax=Drosophila busckii TaxID=30019 RepID=UPI0014332672|nr:sodium channel protein Nach [Drosophila busckii]